MIKNLEKRYKNAKKVQKHSFLNTKFNWIEIR